MLGGSSDPSSVTIDGVRSTALGWDDPSGWPAATEGVDAVYVVRPDRSDAPELVAGLVAHTPAHAHVVLLSGQEAGASPPDRWALRVEHAVRDSGRSWTLLRPGWFMQVFTDARFFRDQIVAGELHVELTLEEAVTGMEGFERRLSALTFERLHAGVYAEVTDTVERVTGHPARSLRTFLDDSWPVVRSPDGTPPT